MQFRRPVDSPFPSPAHWRVSVTRAQLLIGKSRNEDIFTCIRVRGGAKEFGAHLRQFELLLLVNLDELHFGFLQQVQHPLVGSTQAHRAVPAGHARIWRQRRRTSLAAPRGLCADVHRDTSVGT